MDIYTAKKEVKEMRSLIRALIIAANVFNFFVISLYQLTLGKDLSLITNEQGVLDMYLNTSEAIIVIILSITIYILLVLAMIRNIKNKMRNGFKKVNIDKKLVSAFISFCVALGIIASKKTYASILIPAIVVLLLSYIFALTIPGFHRFYLMVKEKRTH